jgi:hypothetical protein
MIVACVGDVEVHKWVGESPVLKAASGGLYPSFCTPRRRQSARGSDRPSSICQSYSAKHHTVRVFRVPPSAQLCPFVVWRKSALCNPFPSVRVSETPIRRRLSLGTEVSALQIKLHKIGCGFSGMTMPRKVTQHLDRIRAHKHNVTLHFDTYVLQPRR